MRLGAKTAVRGAAVAVTLASVLLLALAHLLGCGGFGGDAGVPDGPMPMRAAHVLVAAPVGPVARPADSCCRHRAELSVAVRPHRTPAPALTEAHQQQPELRHTDLAAVTDSAASGTSARSSPLLLLHGVSRT
jgi:hypothetical protein